MNIKKLPYLVLVGILAFFPNAHLPGAGDAPVDTDTMPIIRLAYSRVIDDLPFFVGLEAGLFEQEGVNVELIHLTGATNLLAAVFKNEIQAAVIGVSQVYSAAQQKIPIKVVSWLGRAHAGTHCGLHVRSDGGIRSLENLRGKRIAVSGEISNRMIVSQALARGGMTKDDVEIILGLELSEPMQHEAVLKSKRVDVIVA